MRGTKEINKFLLIVSFLIVGCSPSALDEADYIKYVKNEKNDLRQLQKIAGVEFDLQYEPINFKVLKKIKNKRLSKASYEEEVRLMEGTQYFVFRIRLMDKSEELLKSGADSKKEYSERVQYFSYGIQNDFYLLDGEDSLKCKLFHFERDYGISNNSTFLLGFDSKDELIKLNNSFKENTMNDKVLVYNDRVFGLGPIKYVIKKQDINKIPELIIKYDVE